MYSILYFQLKSWVQALISIYPNVVQFHLSQITSGLQGTFLGSSPVLSQFCKDRNDYSEQELIHRLPTIPEEFHETEVQETDLEKGPQLSSLYNFFTILTKSSRPSRKLCFSELPLEVRAFVNTYYLPKQIHNSHCTQSISHSFQHHLLIIE